MPGRSAVAFLFTDIEGSTRLLRGLGEEAFGAVLGEHGRVLTEAVVGSDGSIVDMQGDACFAAFPTAVGAVSAAIDAQRKLSTMDWPGGSMPRVRMGVHLGYPVAASGGYLGLDVHLAARIGAVAHGQQVLVSEAVRTALLPAPGSEPFSLRSVGRIALKDFDEPQRLWQVVAPDLREEFPQPGRAAHELPFAGRESELADAAASAIARSARRQERRRIFAGLGVVAVIAAAVLAYLSTRPPTVPVVGNSVAELNVESGRVIRDVPLHALPTAVAAGPAALYVVSGGAQGTVTRIDQATGSVQTRAAAGSTDIAVGFGHVWVANGLTRSITQLDPSNLTFAGKIPITRRLGVLGVADAHLAIGTHAVWVDNGGDGGVTALNPVNLAAGAPVAGLPTGAISAANTSVWVGSGSYYFGGGIVVQLDQATRQPLATFNVGEVDGLAVGFGAGWVSDSATGTLEKLRPAPPGTHNEDGQVTARIPLGPGIGAVTVGNGRVWVANPHTGRIFGVDPHADKIVSQFAVHGSPTKLVDQGGHLWMAVQPQPTSVPEIGTRIAVSPGDIDTVDPAASTSAMMWQVEYDAGLNLMRYADAPGRHGLQIVPDAATRMPRVRDHGTVYTFTIRRGLEFSPPSDQPVTAATFRYTLERVFRVASDTFQGGLDFDIAGNHAFANGAPELRGITARENRLTIRLTGDDPDLLARLALPPFAAVPTNWSNPGAGGGVPSAGPYYVRASAAGRVELVRNPNYTGTRPANLPAFTVVEKRDPWRAVAKGNAAYAADGDAPTRTMREALISRLGPGSAADAAGRQRIFLNPFPAVLFIAMHTASGPFANPLVRRAVNFAIDRPALAATLPGPAQVTDQYLPNDTPGYPGSGHAYPLQGPDLRIARQLIHESGVSLPIHATYYTSNDASAQSRARVLKQNLRAIGIVLRVKAVPFQTLEQDIDNPLPYALIDGNFQFFVDDPVLLLVGPPADFQTGPFTPRFQKAAVLAGPRRYRTFGRLELRLARSYAPAAAYAYSEHLDFFAPGIHCQLYQPFFGIEIGKLCNNGQ